jgi:membrane protease YdiL (CAAX protease family)
MGLFLLIVYISVTVILVKPLTLEFKKAKLVDLKDIFIYSIIAIISTTFFLIFLGYLIDAGFINQVNSSFISEDLVDKMIIAIPFFVILAPMLEEYFFRVILANNIRKDYGYKQALVLSAVIFSLYHILFSNSDLIVILISFSSLFLLGFILAKCYFKRNSLLSSFIVHSLHNLFILGLYIVL